jgi:hypothetical protein
VSMQTLARISSAIIFSNKRCAFEPEVTRAE